MATTNIANVAGAMMSRAKYSPAKTRTKVQSRSNVRTSRSCFMGKAQILMFFAGDVRKLNGRCCCAKQKPKSDNEDRNLNEHGEEEGHETQYISGRDPARRATCRLDNRNARLRRAKKINEKLRYFKKHHQHRKYDADCTRHDAGPNGSLDRKLRWTSRRIGKPRRKARVSIKPYRGECQHQEAGDCQVLNQREATARSGRPGRPEHKSIESEDDRDSADRNLHPEAEPTQARKGPRQAVVCRRPQGFSKYLQHL